MKFLKKFEEFPSDVVRKTSPSIFRARSLKEESERKYKSMNIVLKKIGLSNDNANDIIEYCYDIALNLIRAKLYLDGFSCSGKGAHEAEVAYMRVIGFREKDVIFMNDLRYFRNGIKYYGDRFDKQYAEKVIKYLEFIYPKLKNIAKTS